MRGSFDGIAAVGDVSDPSTWSGTPFHFWQATRRAGWEVEPWRLDLSRFGWKRRKWNLGALCRGRRPGGYQYSGAFLGEAESRIPEASKAGHVLSFNQFYPRGDTLSRFGGRLTLYIDATFPRLLDRYGLNSQMDRVTAKEALAAEKHNLDSAATIIAFQNWTAESLVHECGVDRRKVHVVLPGANLDLAVDPETRLVRGIPGEERPLVLGFVGKDWHRKGLPFLVAVGHILVRMGVKVTIRCAGGCPPDLKRDPLLDPVGFLDKRNDSPGFVRFLQSCDFGCLFSKAEASSIAMLEFLRVGVPVAGFVVDGMGDLLLPGASLRFQPEASAESVAEAFAGVIRDSGRYAGLRKGAEGAMAHVTWDRCLREIAGVLKG
jgi:glycosyltransferase involved in cell wall biosynthesis